MNAGSQILLNALSPEQLVNLLRPMIREEIRQALSDQEEKLLSPAETCKLSWKLVDVIVAFFLLLNVFLKKLKES